MEENKISKFNLSIPSAIVIAGVLIAGAILLKDAKPSQDAQNLAPQEISLRDISDKDHVRGDLELAKIIIVEYSDTECPFCKRFHGTIKQVLNDYKGKVAWVYRHFPLDALHSKARKEAEATECAAELGGNEAFWKYIDRIFEITPANNGLDPAELPKIAEFIGLDVSKFNECLSSGRYADKVDADAKDGTKAGAQGTPYSIIMTKNGKKKIPFSGAQPIENIKQVIDSLI